MSVDPGTNPGSGRLFVISAPSGAGKSTLCQALRARFPNLAYSVSSTTRAPRPGERDGRDYHFTDADTFQKMIAAGQWAEWAKVHGNYYGTSKALLEECLNAGRDILLDIDVQGMRQIVAVFPQAITIFILPPSLAVLRQRLQQRGTDDPQEIARRMQTAETEMQYRHQYRHRIVNDDLTTATEALVAIVEGRRKADPAPFEPH